jgi:ABC-type uncharacterized transport system ATPase subunit
LARSGPFGRLGVRGSQVQILSARQKKPDEKLFSSGFVVSKGGFFWKLLMLDEPAAGLSYDEHLAFGRRLLLAPA